MRSTFAGLNTMVGGIQTNRLSLETVGHNISNSATVGYSRQSVNQAATRGQGVYTVYGEVIAGTGVSARSLTRARDMYADRQYWKENAANSYFAACNTNYEKIEMIFNDSNNNGVQNALEAFYAAWTDCSTTASTATSRQNVINQGQIFYERLDNAENQVQNQIIGTYDEMAMNLERVNMLTSQIVDLNKNIMMVETTGSSANDLRDQRDLIVDELTGMMSLNVYEEDGGMYALVCNGTSIVNGVSKLTLELSKPVFSPEYGVSDYVLQVKETGVAFSPMGGELQAQLDCIREDKEYMDYLSNMAAFCLTSVNEQHRAGAGIDSDTTTGINFYGDDGYHYTWDSDNSRIVKTKCNVSYTYTPDSAHILTSVKFEDDPTDVTYLKGKQILDELHVNTKLMQADVGQTYLATRSLTYDKYTSLSGISKDISTSNLIYPQNGTYTIASHGINGTGDGTNAVNVGALLNCDMDNCAESDVVNLMQQFNGSFQYRRPIGTVSLYAYYNTQMTTMGSRAEAMQYSADFQADIMTQIYNLRQSTAGVNWDEELSNMIMFQQGYSACSRCLTTMDEMLDKLINGTGMVGR